MDGFAIFLLALIVFLAIDMWFFMLTPLDFRLGAGRWWRFLPGGGIAVYVAYKFYE